jgi:uncharacterized protein YndB with AHSA1/START domain
MEKVMVEQSIWIVAARDRVWQAVTNPDQIVQWFVPNLPGAVMKKDDTGTVSVFLGEMGVEMILLEALDSQRHVNIRSLPEKLLTTTYKLEDQKDGTLVTVTLAGFEGLPEETREDRLNFIKAGWEKTLKNLKAFVEGAELPFPKAYVGQSFGYWRQPKERLGIERSIWIDAPRERVWDAITDPKQIQNWFSPNTEWHVSALEVGGKFYANNPETNAETSVEVIEVLNAPYQLLTRTVPEAPDIVVKSKLYTLVEENGGTRLILTLIGYEPEADSTRWDHMEQDAFGFGMMLQNTKAHVEGKPLPFPWGF